MSEGYATLPEGFAARLRLAQRQIPGGLVLALVDVLVVEIAIVLAAAVVSSVGASGWTLLAWDPVPAVTAATTLLVANIQLGLYDTVGQGRIERFRLRLKAPRSCHGRHSRSW